MSDREYIHVCPVCEYVHEEHETTPFEEMPDSYVCPACGVEHGWFEKRVV